MKKINFLGMSFVLLFPILLVASEEQQSSFGIFVDPGLLAAKPEDALNLYLLNNGYRILRSLRQSSDTHLEIILGDGSVKYIRFDQVTTPGEYFGKCYCVATDNTAE